MFHNRLQLNFEANAPERCVYQYINLHTSITLCHHPAILFSITAPSIQGVGGPKPFQANLHPRHVTNLVNLGAPINQFSMYLGCRGKQFEC